MLVSGLYSSRRTRKSQAPCCFIVVRFPFVSSDSGATLACCEVRKSLSVCDAGLRVSGIASAARYPTFEMPVEQDFFFRFFWGRRCTCAPAGTLHDVFVSRVKVYARWCLRMYGCVIVCLRVHLRFVVVSVDLI